MITEKVPHSFLGGRCVGSLWNGVGLTTGRTMAVLTFRIGICPLKSYLNAKKSQHFNVQQVEYFFALLWYIYIRCLLK